MTRLRSVPNEATLAARAFRYQPPDPVWAPTESLERTRRALRAHDSYLNLFWSPMRRFNSTLPGRWRIVQWLAGQSIWNTLMFWEGPNGEYRDPTPDAIMNEVHRSDAWARGEHLGHVSDKVDAKNEAFDKKKKATASDEALRDATDKADYGYSPRTGRIDPKAARKKNFTMGAGAP